MTDKAQMLTDEPLLPSGKQKSQRFRYKRLPSEQNMSLDSLPESENSSPTDVFDLVFSLDASRLIWQLKSLFCYRGLWQDDRKTAQSLEPSEVILTVATGVLRIILWS
jgi:hypothetical protein